MKTQGVPGIALSESNQKGSQYFMSLYTGNKIHAFRWKELPVHDDVINRVEELAEIEKQPKMSNRVPLFEWSPGVEIVNEDQENIENNNNNIEIEEVNEENEQEIVEQNIITDEEDAQDQDSNQEEENHKHNEPIVSPLQQENFLQDEENDDKDISFDNNSESQERELASNNSNDRPRRANAGAGVERFEPRFGEKSYELNRKVQYMQFKRKKKRVQLAQIKKLMKKVRDDGGRRGDSC